MKPEDNNSLLKILSVCALALLLLGCSPACECGTPQIVYVTVEPATPTVDAEATLVAQVTETSVPPTSTVTATATLPDVLYQVGELSHDELVREVAIAPEGDWYAVAELHAIRIENLSPVGPRPIVVTPDSDVWDIAWSADSGFLAAATDNGDILIWNSRSGELVATLSNEEMGRSVSWSHDGTQLAAGFSGGALKIWDTSSWNLSRSFQLGGDRWITGIAWSADDSTMVSSGGFGLLALLDSQSGEVLQTFDRHLPTGWVTRAEFSRDYSLLASTDGTGFIRIWDMSTMASLKRMNAHTGGVHGLAWSPIGKWIATGDDEAISIWDAQSGELAARVPVESPVTSLTWEDTWHDLRLVSSHENGLVNYWDMSGLH